MLHGVWLLTALSSQFSTCAGIGIFILGRRLNLFSAPSLRMKEFQSAGLSFIDNLAPMSGIIPWYKFFPTPTSVRFENAVRCLEAIARELAEERMTELKQKIDSGEEFEAISFLDQWLLDDRISREDIFTLMRDFLSAGIDTVSIEIVSSEVRASQLAQACEGVVLPTPASQQGWNLASFQPCCEADIGELRTPCL